MLSGVFDLNVIEGFIYNPGSNETVDLEVRRLPHDPLSVLPAFWHPPAPVRSAAFTTFSRTLSCALS